MLDKPFNKMTTVYGGQFGSEGKGQIVRFITEVMLGHSPAGLLAYRIGGPNAGHTFYLKDEKIVTCQIPGPMFFGPPVTGIIGPEGVISLEVLGKELQDLAQFRRRHGIEGRQSLIIDNNATIISEEQHNREATLVKVIGSTGKGVGAATADKVMRTGKIALDNHSLQDLLLHFSLEFDYSITDTINWTRNKAMKAHPLFAIIEGPHGAGLSLHTSDHYPYCTSRECTPQGIWAGCGLHPQMADYSESVMVVRTYPIRVAGPSGPMYLETSWDEISRRAGREVKEITTVTKNVRRVAELDFTALNRTIAYTRPDCIALTFLDYIDPDVYQTNPNRSEMCQTYVHNFMKATGVPVRYVGTGEGHVYVWLH
jgi:adenylosuccinate synthase